MADSPNDMRGDANNGPANAGEASAPESTPHGYIYNPDTKMERRRQEDSLGADIIDECRTQLMLKFRFLDMALWRMDLEPVRVGSHYPLATDGKKVFYDPPRTVARFKQSFDESVRDYLHMIMHCIFRHPYDKGKHGPDAWNLTCDIIVENAIIDLCGSRFKSDSDLERMMELSRIKMAAGGMTPSKIYDLVANLAKTPAGQHYRGVGASKLADWRALFERDDHAAWPKPGKPDQEDDTSTDSPKEELPENEQDPDMQSDGLRQDSPDKESGEGMGSQGQLAEDEAEDSKSSQGGGQADADDPADQEEQQQDQQDQPPEEQDDGEQSEDQDQSQDSGFSQSSQDEHSGQQSDDDQAEKDWEEVSKQIEMNLHTFSKEWGEEAASLLANLQMANRKKHDYADFLRKFMTINEEMQLNMDEFDITFYTFGMDMYGNMPFIEPLEYKETNRIRDFVIAIDTSESVKGELVRKFIEQTFDILKSSEEYSSAVNIHVIQADNKVQSDMRITNMRDVDRLMSNFVIRGLGGTDFRPAFDYVEALMAKGELEDLQGMIYFTDGFGQFPERAPGFQSAFVFLDDEEHETPPVPPWAIKVVIDNSSLEEGRR